jgi:hypothetical protein
LKFTHTPEKRLPKLTAACSKDKSLPVLQHVNLNVELGELQATTKYVAVRVPVEVEKGDTSGVVDPAAVDAATKSKASNLKVGKTQHPKVGEFPKLEELWPTGKEVGKPAFRIGFNAEYLLQVAQAIGAKGGAIELIFPAYGKDGPRDDKPIVVRPMLKENQGSVFGVELEERVPADGVQVAMPEGLLMPIRLLGGPAAAAAPAKTKGGTATKTKAAANGKPEIPYAGIPLEKLTAGQKAARTKALKAAGITDTAAPANGKKDKATVAATVKNAVRGAAKGAKPPKAKATGAKNGNGAMTASGKWTAEAATERARKAAETRRRNAEAAAKA